MAVLGTSVSDPNFYARKAAQTGQAVAGFVDSFRQRKAEQEQREQEEIDQAFKAMASYPELADTWGADIVRKYGHKYPQLSQIVSVVKQRRTLAQELPNAESAYYGALSKLEGGYQAQQENLARMPDAVQAPAPFFGSPFGLPVVPERPTIDLPNPDKAKASRALSEVRPELFPNDALKLIPPRQRDLARVSLKARGIELPEQTIFDPYKQLGEKPRAMLAVEQGKIPKESETARIIRTEGGLDLTEAEKKKQTFQREERQGREEQQTTERVESDKQMRDRIKLQDSLSAARINQRTAAQKDVVAYRKSFGGNEGGDKGRWKYIQKDSEAAVKEWTDKKKAALSGLRGDERIEARKEFEKENPQPTALSQMASRRIARATAGLGEQEADDKALEMSATYMQERRKGTAELEAIKRATGETKAPAPADLRGEARARLKETAKGRERGDIPTPPAPPPPKKAAPKQLFTNAKDDARDWAVSEYMARIEAGAAPDEAKAAVDALLKQYGKVK